MLKNMLTILVLLYSTKLFSGGYPFQEPYRFTPAWVHSRYYLAGDIAIYSKQNVTYQTMSPLIPSTIKNRPTEFVANKKYSLLNGPFSKGLDGSRKCNNYKLPNPFNIGTTIIFTPNNEKFPTAVITRQGDLISMYVGHPQQEANGSKLTFNIDSFEKYMKTTSWYDSLDYQTGGKTKIDRVMSFGFAFNADKSNFEILNQNSLFPDAFTINMLFITLLLDPTSCSPIPVYIKDIDPLPSTWKWKDKNIKNSYDDLLKTNNITWKGKKYSIPPSITTGSMSESDFTNFKALINKGNTN